MIILRYWSMVVLRFQYFLMLGTWGSSPSGAEAPERRRPMRRPPSPGPPGTSRPTSACCSCSCTREKYSNHRHSLTINYTIHNTKSLCYVSNTITQCWVYWPILCNSISKKSISLTVLIPKFSCIWNKMYHRTFCCLQVYLSITRQITMFKILQLNILWQHGVA